MTVNHLPVLTWNKLDFNTAQMSSPQEIPAWKDRLVMPELPAGMTLTITPSDEADECIRKILKETKAPNPEEKGTGVEGYDGSLSQEAVVAGKYPIYAKQTFATGMGAEADALLKENKVPLRVVTIEAQKKIAEPVILKYEYENEAVALDALCIHAKKYSEVTIICYYTGTEGSGFAGTSVKVIAEEGARIRLVSLQMLPKGFAFFDDCGARLCRQSDLRYTQLEIGAAKVYTGMYADQYGDKSVFRSDMGYLGLKDSFLDFNYVDTFRGSKTEGQMIFEGVLLDNAKKISRETLDFRQSSTDAIGDEEENILVLGADTVNKANPMILGEEEKVSGRHAVSIGRLSPEMLFYMQTRGISAETAQEMMIRAKIARVSEHIPDATLKDAIGAYLNRVFCKNPDCEGYCRT